MRVYLTATLPLALMLASGCWRRTELAATWHEPTPTLLGFNHTVSIFATTDESMRRAVEDQIAAKFPNTTPSYRTLPHAGDVDKNAILQQMRSAGYDGAIVMRVTNVTQQVTYNGTYWGGTYGFAGYWDNAWASPYNPAYVQTTEIVSVETNIYSLKDDKLVFAALSQTSDPANVGKLVRSVMRHINEQLKKDGMIVSAPTQPGDVDAEVAAP